jgi:hypothetical protein
LFLFVPVNISFASYSNEVVKTYPIFDGRLDTSHHGQPSAFRDVGVVSGRLTGFHNAMNVTVKRLFIVKRSRFHRAICFSPQAK